MKKLISAVLATAIAGTAFAAAPTALAKTTTYKQGKAKPESGSILKLV